MKLIPILFSTLMVSSIRKGIKTVTRRLNGLFEVNGNPDAFTLVKFKIHDDNFIYAHFKNRENGIFDFDPEIRVPCEVDDVLWIRETFFAYGWWIKEGKTKTGKPAWTFKDFTVEDKGGNYHYMDCPPDKVLTKREENKMGWYKRPSIFIPYHACRHWLKVTALKVERLHDLKQEDAISEGIEFPAPHRCEGWNDPLKQHHDCYICPFKVLWTKLNGASGHGWDKNNWVWAISFIPTEKPE